MNALIAPYSNFGGDYFVSPVAADCNRQLNSIRLLPLQELSAGAIGTFTNGIAGIAENVKQIVVGRSANLSPALRQKIGELAGLKPNWDGDGAIPIKSHVLADVVETLKRFARRTGHFQEPFLVPVFNGFVQMEWHGSRRSLEIEARPEGWSLVGSMTSMAGEKRYFSAGCERTDFEQLDKFYGWFEGNELIWPSL